MKWRSMVTIVLALISVTSGIASVCDAGNEQLAHECRTKALKAAALINTDGAEAAFKKITDPKGPFVGKKSHVFCFDSDSGTLLAHKVARFVGVNMNYYQDANRNTPYAQILKRAQQEQSGWLTYMSHGSGPERRDTPALKHMHFYKVPGKNMILCCGYWEE